MTDIMCMLQKLTLQKCRSVIAGDRPISHGYKQPANKP